MKYQLAFVIPVYNIDEKLLERCIDSIQDIVDIKYEIIIVDDGSTEEKSKKYNALVKKYSDCFLFHKENGGVSSARNYGLRCTEAEYVYFVDADDEIEPMAFSQEILKETIDICFSDISIKNSNGEMLWKAFSKEGEVAIEDVLKRMSMDGKINGPYGKIIRCDFLKQNDIFYPEDMIHAEDGMFLVKMLSYMPKMHYFCVNSYYYNYSEAETGLLRVLSHPDSIIKALKLFHEKINEMILSFVEKDEICEILYNEEKKYIKGLLNIAAELALVYKLKGNNMNLISESAMTSDKVVLQKLTGVSKLRYLLLRDKRYVLIYIYGCIRKIYLTIKGN